MQTTQSLWLPQSAEAAQSLLLEPLEQPPVAASLPVRLCPPPDQAPDNRVRIVIYGSADAVSTTIAQLHQLRFIEQFRWNPIRSMPANGIHIPPEHPAYSFLLKAVR